MREGKRSRLLQFGAALGIAAFFTACASDRDTFRTAGQLREDRAIAREVAEQLERAPVYKYPDVRVNSYQGRLQLSGFVANEDQKQMAEMLARSVPGVISVQNDLLLKNIPSNVGGTR